MVRSFLSFYGEHTKSQKLTANSAALLLPPYNPEPITRAIGTPRSSAAPITPNPITL